MIDPRIALGLKGTRIFDNITQGIQNGQRIKQNNLRNELLKKRSEQIDAQNDQISQQEKLENAKKVRDYISRVALIPQEKRGAVVAAGAAHLETLGISKEELIGQSYDDQSLKQRLLELDTVLGRQPQARPNYIDNKNITEVYDPESGQTIKVASIELPDGTIAQQRIGRVAPKEQKLSALEEKLTAAGYAKGTPEYQMAARKLLEGRPLVQVNNGGKNKELENFTQESNLRKDFDKESQDFIKRRDFFGNIQAAAQNPSPASDLSLIINYQKMNDPNSVVRESEFKQAASSGSLGQKIQAAFTRVDSGKILTDEQRADFLNSATEIMAASEQEQQQRFSRYEELAKSYNLVPTRIVRSFEKMEGLQNKDSIGNDWTEIGGIKVRKKSN